MITCLLARIFSRIRSQLTIRSIFLYFNGRVHRVQILQPFAQWPGRSWSKRHKKTSYWATNDLTLAWTVPMITIRSSKLLQSLISPLSTGGNKGITTATLSSTNPPSRKTPWQLVSSRVTFRFTCNARHFQRHLSIFYIIV